MTRDRIAAIVLFGGLALAARAAVTDSATSESLPAFALSAFDVPGDRGDAIGLTWAVHALDGPGKDYVVSSGPSAEGPFEPVTQFPSTTRYESDVPAVFGYGAAGKERHYISVPALEKDDQVIRQYYRIALEDVRGEKPRELALSTAATALAKQNWFAPQKTNNLILTLLCSGFILLFIHLATKNPHIFIRKLAGLEAIDEAVGRATEMGKPILYLTGYYDIDRTSAIASVNILSHVARKVAEFDSRLIIPSKWSIVMTVCQEVVKEAYTNAGRPDAYNPNDIYYIAGEQFSYTAAIDGVMVREKPAANFLLGTFAAEALILAETGASTGAIQISGTDSMFQIPFFVVACDYCLIGEELYAASAYLSREPRLLGSLKGQDAGKLVVMAAILLGTILVTAYTILPAAQKDAFPILMWIKNFFTPL